MHSLPCFTGELAARQLAAEYQRVWSEKHLLQHWSCDIETFPEKTGVRSSCGNAERAAPKLKNDLIEEGPAVSFPSFSGYVKSLGKVTRKY